VATQLATIPGGGNGHVVWTAHGLYVTGFRANRLFKVSAEGEVTPFAGTGRFGQNDGPAAEAQFSTPNGIAYDRSRDVFYVNDRLETWPERWEGRAKPTTTVRQILMPTLEGLARSTFEAEGAEATKQAVGGYVDTHPGRPYEIVLDIFGYRLLGGGEAELAVAVFELNTERFPTSANAWDSLGEAYQATGQREPAIAAYRKSLELDPGNTNARDKLAELEAG
jgi:tetratricopeptide (TPR) repeat protein